MQKKPARKASRETNQLVLHQAMVRRLPSRVAGSGRMLFPAVPSLAERYTEVMHKTFALLGRVFNRDEIATIRDIVKKKCEEGFRQSPYARIIVEYGTNEPPETSLSYKVFVEESSVEAQYERWTQSRTPPLFGSMPDAKIMSLARSLGPPAESPILDIGAGTGRNTLPLAREGFPVDAIELAPTLVEILSRDAKAEDLPVRIIQGDAVAEQIDLPEPNYKMVFLSEVIASHIRDVPSCRRIFEEASQSLAPGGILAFNAFMAVPTYFPDPLAREWSQVVWSVAFTQKDMKIAMEGLPFELVSDESVYEYEREHCPEEHWPPTGWFEKWSQGMDVFDLPDGKSPLELRWLVYRKTGQG